MARPPHRAAPDQAIVSAPEVGVYTSGIIFDLYLCWGDEEGRQVTGGARKIIHDIHQSRRYPIVFGA